MDTEDDQQEEADSRLVHLMGHLGNHWGQMGPGDAFIPSSSFHIKTKDKQGHHNRVQVTGGLQVIISEISHDQPPLLELFTFKLLTL